MNLQQVGKKGLICALALTMSLAVVPPAMAAEPPENQVAKIEFSDISGHWAEKDILAMCEGENPLFNGVGTGADGKAIFAPDNKMTGYEFITVIVRALYPDEIRATQTGESWWAPSYEVAASHSLLYNDLDLSQPISRQSMAKIMAKVLKKQGEDTSKLVSTSKIADYDTIGGYYQHDVRVVYSLGIITGTDSNGTFAPTATVTRAQGATILHRLLDKSCRATVDLTQTQRPSQGSSALQYANGKQEFKEGENHYMPQVGDVVIKADGTRITIEEGIGGVLGAGQGVDIWTGTLYNNVPLKEGMGIHEYSLRPFVKDEKTSEMHSIDEWLKIQSATDPSGKFIGEYEGEVYNTWWKWTDRLGGHWTWMGPV